MRSIFRQNRIWFYGERHTIFNVQLLDPVEQSIEGVTMYRFTRDGLRLLQRIDARSARYRRGRWELSEATIRTFLPDARSGPAPSRVTTCGVRRSRRTSRSTAIAPRR